MERSNPVLARAVEDAITAAVGAPRFLADKLIQQEPRLHTARYDAGWARGHRGFPSGGWGPAEREAKKKTEPSGATTRRL